MAGYTGSSDFPTLNPYHAILQGSWDAFVTKLSSSGNSLIYSTYLGGGGSDAGYSIAVDGGGNAFVTGGTSSSDYPILNPFQGTHGGHFFDVFVTKLSTSGSSLIYSTYIGGEGYEYGRSIAVDNSGSAYVTGYTTSSNFPTLNPYQSTYQGGYHDGDVFVTKLSNSGNGLIYSTYLGESGDDYGNCIAVDGGGNAYVIGETFSSSFPTLNPYQTNQDYLDAFVTKFSNSGGLIYSTYLGGSDVDCGTGIAVDGSGNAYVTGYTGSNFPTLNPCQTYHGDGDVFVTKLSWTPDYVCGDVNTDEQVNLIDAVFLINYIFVGGPAPQMLSLADVNCSGSINIADVVLLINYIFRAGPVPCAECE